MSPETLVTLAVGLVVVLLVVVAALVWQEAKRRGSAEERVYVISDAVRFVHERLEGTSLRRSDIQRIVEYEVFYLQGLAQSDRKRQVEVVAGGADAAVEFIAQEIAETHGVAYARDDIRRVLALEAEYLASIGAVGEPVDESLLEGDDG